MRDIRQRQRLHDSHGYRRGRCEHPSGPGISCRGQTGSSRYVERAGGHDRGYNNKPALPTPAAEEPGPSESLLKPKQISKTTLLARFGARLCRTNESVDSRPRLRFNASTIRRVEDLLQSLRQFRRQFRQPRRDRSARRRSDPADVNLILSPIRHQLHHDQRFESNHAEIGRIVDGLNLRRRQ